MQWYCPGLTYNYDALIKGHNTAPQVRLEPAYTLNDNSILSYFSDEVMS